MPQASNCTLPEQTYPLFRFGVRPTARRGAYSVNMSVSPSLSLSETTFTDEARAALFQHTLTAALNYLNHEDARPVTPGPDAVAALSVFREPLPEAPSDPEAVLSLL